MMNTRGSIVLLGSSHDEHQREHCPVRSSNDEHQREHCPIRSSHDEHQWYTGRRLLQGMVHPFVACHCKSLRIPFPRVDDILGVLEGAKYFSYSDLLSGYWQIKINSYDKPKASESHGTLPSPITHEFYWHGSCALSYQDDY